MHKVHIFIDGVPSSAKKLGLTELNFNFDEFASFLANERIIPVLKNPTLIEHLLFPTSRSLL